MRVPIDSRKLKDSGKDFDAIYKQWNNPELRVERTLLKWRQERFKNNKEDKGL